jgi:hypothetical protein
MTQTLRHGGPDALNVYSTRAGAYLGWAYLPEIVTKPGQVHLDGVVIDWESPRRVSDTYEGRYDQGKTATHEVGHWLNLEHTLYGGRLRCRLFVHRNVARLEVGSGAARFEPSGPSTLLPRTIWEQSA